MGYTPENNPYIPGDPYSYDLKWIVTKIKELEKLGQIDITQEVSDKLDEMAQDGTLEALIAQIFPWESVATKAELTGTVSEYVYVSSIDCWYWRHKNNYTGNYETDGGITRDDGSVVFPMPDQSALVSSAVPKTDIGRVIASYMKETGLTYGSDYTMYDQYCTNEADCATFINAILNDTLYEDSRYVLGDIADNIVGSYAGFRPPISSNHSSRMSLRTWQMAEWFAEHKQLYSIPKIKEAAGMLQYGDLLFSGSYDNAAPGVNARYYGIDHVMMVVQTFPDDGAVLVAQMGGAGAPTITHVANFAPARLTLISFANNIGKNYQVFARPTYGNGMDTGTNISDHVSFRGQITADGSDGQILALAFPSVKLKNDTLYTVTVRGTLPNYNEDGCWMYVRGITYDSATQYNIMRNYHLQSNGKEINLVGVLHSNAGVCEDIDFLEICLESTDKIGTPTFEVTEVAITEGINFGANGTILLPFELIDDTNFTVTSNKSRISDGKVIVDVDINKITSATGDFTIGQFANMPYYSYNRYLMGTMEDTDLVVLKIGTSGDSGKLFFTDSVGNTGHIRTTSVVH